MTTPNNPFLALAGCGERDPKKLLKKGKNTPSNKSASNQPVRKKQDVSASSSSACQFTARTCSLGNSQQDEQPKSPGLAAALAAVERAEQADKGQWSAIASAASTTECATPTGTDSPAQKSPCKSHAWASSMDHWVDDGPWQLSPQLLSQQQLLVGSNPEPQQLSRQQQRCSPCGRPPDLSPAAPSPAVLQKLGVDASLWQQLACEFAANASAAGDSEAAAKATRFSEQVAAVFLLSDSTTAAALAAAVQEAADAGVSAMELLAAQQKALMLEAEATTSAAAAAAIAGDQGLCSRAKQPWASAAAKQPRSRLLAGSGSSLTAAQPKQRPCASSALTSPVKPETDYSALPSTSNSSSTPHKSPHSIPRGWKSGRLAPQVQGIRAVNLSSSSCNSGSLRPSSLDLHWDLQMDGLRLKEDVELSLELQCALSDAEAAVATRLLVEQQATEAARGGDERHCLSQDAMRSMMNRAAAAAHGGSSGDEQQEAVAGSRHCGRDYHDIWAHMMSTGWVPVSKREGGGGTHYKFRRTLPLSGIVQTIVLPSSPSDSQRGERNAAAAVARLDRQARELESEAQAAAATEKGAAGASTKARACSSK